MKTLAWLIFGSIVTATLLALLLLIFRPRPQRVLPAYWLGLISALAWLPGFIIPPIKAALAKDPMPAFEWVIASVIILPVLGIWSMLCSIFVRITGSVYARVGRKKDHREVAS